MQRGAPRQPPVRGFHLASILAKLGLRDRVQVVLYAHHPAALARSETPGGATSSSP
jgi:hypothetical protein